METIRQLELEISGTLHKPSMKLLVLLADPTGGCDVGL
jgi:hypothetical protein